MIPRGPAPRLTVHLGESDAEHGRPLFSELVHRAHRAGLAGGGPVTLDEVEGHRG